jgi:hypothetical protein
MDVGVTRGAAAVVVAGSRMVTILGGAECGAEALPLDETIFSRAGLPPVPRRAAADAGVSGFFRMPPCSDIDSVVGNH